MPTDEERREAASSLKHCDIVCNDSGRYPYSFNGSICGCMLVGQSDTAVRAATSFLAGLIEPKPERTCEIVTDGIDEAHCSACGYEYDYHDGTGIGCIGPEEEYEYEYNGEYCKNCGAKVMNK